MCPPTFVAWKLDQAVSTEQEERREGSRTDKQTGEGSRRYNIGHGSMESKPSTPSPTLFH